MSRLVINNPGAEEISVRTSFAHQDGSPMNVAIEGHQDVEHVFLVAGDSSREIEIEATETERTQVGWALLSSESVGRFKSAVVFSNLDAESSGPAGILQQSSAARRTEAGIAASGADTRHGVFPLLQRG